MNNDIYTTLRRLIRDDDRITAYLKGRMSPEDEHLFMIDLMTNPTLRANAVMAARIVKALKQVGASQDRETVDAFLAAQKESVHAAAHNATRQDVETDCQPHKTKFASMRKTAIRLTVAASVVTVIWLGIGYNNYRYTIGLGRQYDDVFASGMIARGADEATAATQKLEALFDNVKNGENLGSTIHDLSLCWELSTMDTYNDYTDYSPLIGWNLAIAHLKDGNKKDARTVLQKLVDTTEPESAVYIKANELLDKLK